MMPNQHLIYSCVFFKKDYLDLLNLLLESFSRHDKSNTKYLIITNSRFEPTVKDMFEVHSINGDTWVIDNIPTQFEATCARLHIFDYPEMHNYETFLYLDVDILITNPMGPIFDIELKADKLYCYNQDITLNDWGRSKQLFIENEVDIDFDRSVFSTCVMLFRNTTHMQELFSDIKTHIAERVPDEYDLDGAFEEDFVIYQCFIKDCYDDQYLTAFVRSNCVDNDTNMIINHFCAVYKVLCATPDGKIDRMHKYLSAAGVSGYSRNIIHIGANVGDCYSKDKELFQVFDIVSPNDFCFFIEPVPYLFKQLQENYDAAYPDNNFIYINKAVSNHVGEVEMTIASENNDFDKFPFYATMLASVNEDHITTSGVQDVEDLITEKITVPTTTLQEIVKESKMETIDLLVIDAEGHDFEILNAYDFSILPKTIIFEHANMLAGNLSLLRSQFMIMGYQVISITELDMIMRHTG